MSLERTTVFLPVASTGMEITVHTGRSVAFGWRPDFFCLPSILPWIGETLNLLVERMPLMTLECQVGAAG